MHFRIEGKRCLVRLGSPKLDYQYYSVWGIEGNYELMRCVGGALSPSCRSGREAGKASVGVSVHLNLSTSQSSHSLFKKMIWILRGGLSWIFGLLFVLSSLAGADLASPVHTYSIPQFRRLLTNPSRTSDVVVLVQVSLETAFSPQLLHLPSFLPSL